MVALDRKQIAWRLALLALFGLYLFWFDPDEPIINAITVTIVAVIAAASYLFPRYAPFTTCVLIFLFLTMRLYMQQRLQWSDVAVYAGTAIMVGATLWVYKRKGNIALLIPTGFLLAAIAFFVYILAT